MSGFTGAGTLVRLILRRDRLRLCLWVFGIVGVSGATGAALQTTYDTPREMAGYGSTVADNAATLITTGRQVALDTMGGITANETTLVVTIGVTLMAIFTVVRHTRAEEESGAAELVRSGIVGRHAGTLAALLVAVGASVVVGALLAGVLLVLDLDPVGATAYAAEVAMLGVFFAGAGAAAAQVSSSARGALAIAGGLLGVTYVVRGVGAVAESWLVWLSPFGLAQGVDAFGQEQWWLLGVLAVATVGCFVLAAFLAARRDAGAGLLPPRPGPDRAGAALGTPFGLAWRLQRGLVVGWAVGLAALAAIYGSVVPAVPDMLRGNPEIVEALGVGQGGPAALVEAFLGYVNLTLGVLGAVFGVASVLRLRAEEESGRAESLLATGLSRTRWIAASGALTLLGVALMATVMGLGMVVGYVPLAEDGGAVDVGLVSLAAGALAQLPAMLVMAAAAHLVIGWVPRLAPLTWVLVAFVVLEVFVGDSLRLPDAVRSLSPFFHVPPYPAEPWTAGPALVLLGIAGAMAVTGLVAHRRRDIG